MRALVDEIEIVCSDWMDEDSAQVNDQLKYNFYVERIGSDDWYPLYRGPQSSGLFCLAPWGVKPFVRVFMEVEDRQGGRTRVKAE